MAGILDSGESWLLSAKLGEADNWMKWMKEIPYIPFPKHWAVKIVPPFAAAIIRFRVKHTDSVSGDDISVYLDCYDRLGYFGRPYWEAYSINGDTFRCALENWQELIDVIEEEFQKRQMELV